VRPKMGKADEISSRDDISSVAVVTGPSVFCILLGSG